MKAILILIYVYGAMYVVLQNKNLFAKRDWAPGKYEYLEVALIAILWPINWIRRAIEFHLDRPYLKK